MTTIELGNQYSTVIDASESVTNTLNTVLAFKTPGYGFSNSYKSGHWDGMTRFYKKGTNKFPTGLLSDVLVTLKRMGEEYELVDNRDPIDYTLKDSVVLKHEKLGTITLRDYQYESVQKALTATRGVINVATNGGKTEIACGLIQSILPHLKKDERIVFFTHSKEIFTQSAKRISERLGIDVGMVGQGKWDVKQVTLVMIPTVSKYIKKPKQLPKTKKAKDLASAIELATAKLRKKGLSKSDKEILTLEIKDLQEQLTSYDKSQWTEINGKVKRTKELLDSIVCFIGDEVHHASSDTWYKVLMGLKNAYYRFGLTGTVDKKEVIPYKRLLGCTGKIIIKVSNEFLIQEGHSAKPTIYMFPIPEKVLNYSDYFMTRSKGIIHSDVRNQIFVDKIIERANSGKQCLVIVNETTHGDILMGMLKDNGFTVEFSHGECSDKHREKALDDLSSGKLRVLIATSILDEGVDVSGINCLFLVAGGKSMKKLLQRIGRGLRKKEDGSGLEVYDALDYHHEFLAKHTLERYTTYKNEGFDIVKLD